MVFQDFAELVRQLTEKKDTPVREFQPGPGTSFRILVDTDPGRNHVVFVLSSNTELGELVLCSAMAVKLPKGREFTAEMGIELLRRNSTQAEGNWCVMENDDGTTWIALKDTFYLGQVEPHWACARIVMLANIADRFEAELGLDDY